jgi:EAL domain-containing protein (putative c-di-GMP-specific phosphodiesterase class I)
MFGEQGLAANLCSEIVLEPAVSREGKIHSWAMKHKPKRQSHSSRLTRRVIVSDVTFKRSLLEQQLSFIDSLPAEMTRDVFVTLNIDDELADYILDNQDIAEFLLQHRFLRLEIDEAFSEFHSKSKMIKLRMLSQLSHLWLGGFGGGLTNLTLLERVSFEYIKLDRLFFLSHFDTHSLYHLCSYASRSSHGVIVDGVDNEEQQQASWALGAVAASGELWKPLNYCAGE